MSSFGPLLTLRAQLEAASQRWPSVQHRVAFVMENRTVSDGNRRHLQPPDEAEHELLAGGVGTFAEPSILSGDLTPPVLWSYRLTSPNRNDAIGASARFADLASALWNALSLNWPTVICALRCPHPSDTDAGVELRAWLGNYWTLLERAKLVAQFEKMRALLGNQVDWASAYLPERDEWRCVGLAERKPEQLWMLVLHNLAWLGGGQSLLQAERFSWNDGALMHFKAVGELKGYDNEFPSQWKIRLPLEWFASRIKGDVFLASIWAIDEIIKRIESATTSAEGCVRPIAWSNLDEDRFERLIFSIFADAPDYENAQWLTKTNAQDKGRDLSVWKVTRDSLRHTQRFRIIVQCKHWLAKSVAPRDVHDLLSKVPLWAPPPVDELIVATSGRFTTDAITIIERHNDDGKRPRIRMWANSELERIVSDRPNLRKIIEP